MWGTRDDVGCGRARPVTGLAGSGRGRKGAMAGDDASESGDSDAVDVFVVKGLG